MVKYSHLQTTQTNPSLKYSKNSKGDSSRTKIKYSYNYDMNIFNFSYISFYLIKLE